MFEQVNAVQGGEGDCGCGDHQCGQSKALLQAKTKHFDA